MDIYSSLKLKMNQLVHGGPKTVYELADVVHRSHSYLCRISSITEEQPFPVEILVPVMKAQRNYDLLKALAWECGFVMTKLPTGKLKKGDEIEMVAGYQELSARAVKSLRDFLSEPDEAHYNKITQDLKQVVEESVCIKKTCDVKASKQLQLF